METRQSGVNTRRRILNELGQLAGGEVLIHAVSNASPVQQLTSASGSNGSSLNVSNSAIQEDIDSNISNIMNGSGAGRKSSAEEELIRIRGRKKRKSAPSLRDLSPATLATIKSPMKQPTNEDIAYFLRSPTPKKITKSPLINGRKRAHQSDGSLEAKLKRTRKSLEADLFGVNNGPEKIPKVNDKIEEPITVFTNKKEEIETKITSKQNEKESTVKDESNEKSRSSNDLNIKTPKTLNFNQKTSSKNEKLVSPLFRDSPRKNLRRSTSIGR